MSSVMKENENVFGPGRGGHHTGSKTSDWGLNHSSYLSKLIGISVSCVIVIWGSALVHTLGSAVEIVSF